MLIFGDPIIDASALWKIILVALAGGVGIVVVYGFLLLGVKFAAATDATHTQRAKITGYALATLCGLIVLGAIVLGIYAMTQKT